MEILLRRTLAVQTRQRLFTVPRLSRRGCRCRGPVTGGRASGSSAAAADHPATIATAAVVTTVVLHENRRCPAAAACLARIIRQHARGSSPGLSYAPASNGGPSDDDCTRACVVALFFSSRSALQKTPRNAAIRHQMSSITNTGLGGVKRTGERLRSIGRPSTN